MLLLANTDPLLFFICLVNVGLMVIVITLFIPLELTYAACSPNLSDTIDSCTRNMILFYAFVAAATYCPRRSLIDWNCGKRCKGAPGVRPIELFNSFVYHTFALVAFHPSGKELIISFRGTENIFNCFSDFDMRLVPWNIFPDNGDDDNNNNNAKVHSGFLADYLSFNIAIKQTISEQLLHNAPFIDTITCTGHSLGAALATLCALELASVFSASTSIRIRLITFGSPRIGNDILINLITQKISIKDRLRITNSNDIIPHLPPKSLGYEHISGEIYFPPYPDDTIIRCDSTLREDLSCVAGSKGNSLFDHIFFRGLRIRFGIFC